MRPAVFLDRDNTLIEDPGYIHEKEKVKLLHGVAEGLKLLKDAGFLLIVVSNQSGINRGYYDVKAFFEVNERIQQLLKPKGVLIDDFFFCPHRPEENCRCRKPMPGMIEDAVKKWNIDVSKSFVIGDKDSDLMLAVNAGCRGGIKVGGTLFPDFLSCALYVLSVARNYPNPEIALRRDYGKEGKAIRREGKDPL